jgi:CRP-like cAMP-binding protein
MVDPSVLAGTRLFSALPPEAVAEVAGRAAEHRLGRNDVLFHEGDEAADLYIVTTGRIAIANRSADGRESLVALMGPGDLFGEMSLFDGQGRSADARALEPSTVVVVPFDPLRSIVEARPEMLWSIVGLLVERLRAADEALADTVFLDVPGRTAKRLLELAGDADEFTLPITQEELAGMVGASRERVNKAISQFVRLGWMAQSERRYTIIDRTQLERRAR